MPLREILTVADHAPTLKQVSTPVEGGVTEAVRRLMDDMLETMYAAPGIGLAAIQVGVPKRVIVMDLSRGEEERQPRFFVNPEIVWRSDEIAVAEEGCLSVPEIYDEVERPARVRLRYLDYEGAEREEEAEGLFAVCIQHEIDHLEGVLFVDHLSRLKRERAIKRVRKVQSAA
jgi:peptide deformylase